MKNFINWLKEEYILFTQFGPIQRKWLRFLKNNPERQGRGFLGYKTNGIEYVCCLGQFGLMTGICKWSHNQLISNNSSIYLPGEKDMLQYGFYVGGNHKSYRDSEALSTINDKSPWLDVYNACLADPKGYFTKKV
jgi:hypothetical protein